MGLLQAEQPIIGKEDIWPAYLILTAHPSDPSHPLMPAQQASQPAAYPNNPAPLFLRLITWLPDLQDIVIGSL